MISLLLIALAGALNATYEILFVSFKQSIFSNLNPDYWDPYKSWVYKWKMPLKPSPKYWYYFGIYPRYEEKFPYSSTVFVWLTDAWHLFKALMLVCLMSSIVLYTPIFTPIVDFLLLYCTFTFTFTVFFDYILRKNNGTN